MYLKLLNGFVPELHYLENINIKDGKADTITPAVFQLMKKRNLDKNKMTGFGSDGASVMTGKHKGVARQLRDKVPFLSLFTAWLIG